jgi:hypothetical protein
MCAAKGRISAAIIAMSPALRQLGGPPQPKLQPTTGAEYFMAPQAGKPVPPFNDNSG